MNTTADQCPDVVQSSTTGDQHPDVDPVHYRLRVLSTKIVLLLELFEADGTSARLYWAGQGNRIERNYAGVLCTFNPGAARQIPLAHRDIAETLAVALNDGSTRNTDTAFRTWRVTEHWFEA